MAHLVSIAEAAKVLTESGDVVDRSSLSRYVKRHAAELRPIKQGNLTLVDLPHLAGHRRVYLGDKTDETFGDSVELDVARTKKIRAQRLRIELSIGTQQGLLTPRINAENAAHAAIGVMRNSLSQAAGDVAEAIAKALKVEAHVIRPHIRQFERLALAAFVRELQAGA